MTLISAFKDLPDIKIKIAGTGPLDSYLSENPLPNVELLGFTTGDKLSNLIAGATAIIVPSEWEENNPMTIIEAYSLGKPVIGSKIGGITEIIEDGKTGFLFEAFNKTDLKRAIQDLSTLNETEYINLSNNARKFAENNFNSDTHYLKLLEIYKQAIGSNENI